MMIYWFTWSTTTVLCIDFSSQLNRYGQWIQLVTTKGGSYLSKFKRDKLELSAVLNRLITVQFVFGLLKSLFVCLKVPHLIHFTLSVGLIKLHSGQCHCRTDAIAPILRCTWRLLTPFNVTEEKLCQGTRKQLTTILDLGLRPLILFFPCCVYGFLDFKHLRVLCYLFGAVKSQIVMIDF